MESLARRWTEADNWWDILVDGEKNDKIMLMKEFKRIIKRDDENEVEQMLRILGDAVNDLSPQQKEIVVAAFCDNEEIPLLRALREKNLQV
jgi:hypothetical protein